MKARVGEMLKLVQLEGYERRKPTQISGGQAQRVALARALINRPAVLLLDEPLGALDLKLRKQMQIELKRIQQEVGITFIYVTHDQEEAMTMSDRIAVMNSGHYEQLAEPETLYERPKTRFVAGFLGVSNLLAGRSDGADGDYALVRLADDTVIRVLRRYVTADGPIQVGVRPEKIRLRDPADAPPEQHNRLAGHRARCVVHGRQHPVPGGAPERKPDHGLRAERRASQAFGAVGPGRAGRPHLVAGSHLRDRR